MERQRIKTLEVESENGNICEIGVISGVFGAWCAVRDTKPLGFTSVRKLEWVEDFNKKNNS